MKEIWKDIPGWEGLYQASDLGRIKSLGNDKTRKEKVLKPGITSDGYYFVGLHKSGKRSNKRVSRLVFETFKGPIPEGMQVNHINEVKTDNRLCNLNLMTAKENMNWGTRGERASEKMKNKETMSKWVIQLNKNNEILHFYPSIREAERQTGISNQSIANCCSGKPVYKKKTKTGVKVYPLKSSGGFIWKYAE